MKKRIIIVSLIVIGLVMGGTLTPQGAGAWYHMCYVPFNPHGDWVTGLHIISRSPATEVFKIEICDHEGTWTNKTLDLAAHPYGWTGTVSDLYALPNYVAPTGGERAPCALAPAFVEPVRFYIMSTLNKFTVTQIIINAAAGFGLHNFYSWPASQAWPHPDPPVEASEPLAEEEEGWNEEDR